MSYLFLGFFTGLSLILAIGAQNIFVIEQGLKKQHIFLVCFICSISDLILIFIGIFLFHFFNQYFSQTVELILNLLLITFLIYFIYTKIKSHKTDIIFKNEKSDISKLDIFFKTLGFTYLNPHVYSDTVFFLGNFSKNFLIINKYYVGIGASIASFLFFFILGYLSKLLSKHLQSYQTWKRINLFIIIFMSTIALYVFIEILNFL